MRVESLHEVFPHLKKRQALGRDFHHFTGLGILAGAAIIMSHTENPEITDFHATSTREGVGDALK